MKIQLILTLTVAFMFFGCDKNSAHPVPNIPFDFSINLTLPSYSNLNGVSGWCYVNGGSRGIIVYRRGIDDFVAFDRHSPADINGDCPGALFPNIDNYLQLNDTCYNSTFSLYDGSPISGSDYGLRAYQTAWNGNESLRIYN
ncbi:MAG: hypothetical protein QNK85_08510 [Crocinitomicaceae bacterium]|jgi:hypothetical protein